jgi:HEAT repeat protein
MCGVRTILRVFLVGALLLQVNTASAEATTQPVTPLPYGSPMDVPKATSKNATSPHVVEMLGQALVDKPAVSRRVELVHDLGLTGLPTAAPYIERAMSDSEPQVRSEAVRSAAVLGDASLRSALEKLMSDGNADVRREVVRAAAALDDSSLIDAGLKDKDEAVFSAACAVASNEEQDKQIITRLSDLQTPARLCAIRALSRRKALAGAFAVAGQLESRELQIVVAAIDCLAEMKSTEAVGKVRPFLHHPHPTVRRSVVMAMGALQGANEQITIASEMIADPDPSVREAAARLLIAHPSADLVPSLVAQLGAGYPPLNEAARQALIAAARGDVSSATEAVVKLLGHPDPRRREDGSFILGGIKSDAALTEHIRLLQDSDLGVVAQAARSLGQIGREDAGPALTKLIAKVNDGDDALQSLSPDQVRVIGDAFISCGEIHEHAALKPAKRLIPQKLTCPGAIRTRAIWAAGVLGSGDDQELIGELLSVVRDTSPYEIEEARVEAIKAIGNLRYSPAGDEFRKEGTENPSTILRWEFHQVADRLSQTTTPYMPPVVADVADTSIQEIRHE